MLITFDKCVYMNKFPNYVSYVCLSVEKKFMNEY